jgi:ubiquinone/menaquinone biosynthesis C-methylase UbiE
MGLDFTFDYLKIAKKKRRNYFLINGNAETLPYKSESFDGIMSSYLAKYVNIKLLVEECWRVLKHNSIIVFHDFTYPHNVVISSLWNAYFVALKTLGNFVTHWKIVFRELIKVIRNTNWVEEIVYVLEKTGFKTISCKFYTMGTAAIVSAKKP